MEKKTVIIADDHQLFAEGIFSMLNETEFKVIGYAVDGISLLNLMNGFTPDLVLLDINMPRMNGIESAKRIKKEFPTVKIIILTMYEESDFMLMAKKQNIDGFLLKNTDRETLLKAISDVLNGEKVFPKNEPRQVNKYDIKSSTEILAFNQLSSREREVLKLIGSKLKVAEIAETLNLSPHTVDTYRKNLLRKLKQPNMLGLALFATENNMA